MPDNTKTIFATFKTHKEEPSHRYNTSTISNRTRLEGIPRTAEFDRSLRAEIHDPLWMLSRQWQFGEFQGEDAGSAYQARILAEHRRPERLLPGRGQPIAYTPDKPLEMLVERTPVKPNLYRSVEIARYIHRIMTQKVLDHYRPMLLHLYPITIVPDKDDREAYFLGVSVTGRMPDGVQMLGDMRSGKFITRLAAEPDFNSTADKSKMEALQAMVIAWCADFYQVPEKDENAWAPERLEYNFALELPTENGHKPLLAADQFASGHLDWYDFDEREGAASTDPPAAGAVTEETQTFLPAPLRFSGMPLPRYWQMEESRTDFGKIESSATSLLSLLLAEFGLTYSNDWFVLPYELKTNTLCEVKGIMVKDIFGLNILIEPAVNDPETDWQEFAAYHHTERDNDTLEPQKRSRFYLPPVVGKMLESDPVEKVNFLRDEMANMVWAVEQIVPSNSMGGWTQRRSLLRLPQDVDFKDDPESKIRYVLGSTVPENWIPFIPVQQDDAKTEIRLQRARMPHPPLPPGVKPKFPQTQVLTEKAAPYFIEEEEVPRAGVIVQSTFQRTRWLQGRTYLWLGRRKMAGRGEGWSGLMFDQIIPVERKG